MLVKAPGPIDQDKARRIMEGLVKEANALMTDRLGQCKAIPDHLTGLYVQRFIARRPVTFVWKEVKFEVNDEVGMTWAHSQMTVMAETCVTQRLRTFADMAYVSRILNQRYVCVATDPASLVSVRCKWLGGLYGLDFIAEPE